ncbi:hypothetical protein AT574_14915 [Phaeobacter inhibens]|nr:hypothetical protein AT574_14915 [Phaeobacter inhibens]
MFFGKFHQSLPLEVALASASAAARPVGRSRFGGNYLRHHVDDIGGLCPVPTDKVDAGQTNGGDPTHIGEGDIWLSRGLSSHADPSHVFQGRSDPLWWLGPGIKSCAQAIPARCDAPSVPLPEIVIPSAP